MELRGYQKEAVNAALNDLKETHSELTTTERKTALVVAATGAGKSVIMCELARRWLNGWPPHEYKRVLFIVHDQRLVEQNYQTFKSYTGYENVGVYSAGLGRKDLGEQIIFASRASLGRKPDVCGNFDLVVIDEVHAVSIAKDSEYSKILEVQQTAAVAGFTATPYRLDNGLIYGCLLYTSDAADE